LLHIIWLYVRYVRTEDGPMNMYDSIGGAIIYYINQIKCVLYGYHTAYLDMSCSHYFFYLVPPGSQIQTRVFLVRSDSCK